MITINEVRSAITAPTDNSGDDHGIELTFTARQRSCGKVMCAVVSGRSQNTVPIASTQVAIKGIVQYSTRADTRSSVEFGQLATRHSREHTLSIVGPDAQVE